jgi:MraZ protein
MFLGKFYHNLDDKGRLTVPSRFREELASGGAYVMQGFEKNLMVFPTGTFEVVSRRIQKMSMTDPTARLLRRLLFSSADRVDLDKAGRILLPQFLREAAELDTGVVVVGSGEYFEIWTPEEWTGQAEQLMDAQANANRFSPLFLSSDSFD